MSASILSWGADDGFPRKLRHLCQWRVDVDVSTIAMQMDLLLPQNGYLTNGGTFDQRMTFIVDMMREMSRITDPQELVQSYGAKMRQLIPVDGSVSLSRRGLDSPFYRITRSSRWGTDFNPWKNSHRLKTLDAGILGELIYGDEPRMIDNFEPSPDDPAYEYLQGMRSLVAIPLFEQGYAVNMVVLFRAAPSGFPRDNLPGQVWMANLFGRATHTLVLSKEVRQAYDAVERELKQVADIQRSLLPAELPRIERLDVAAYYQTSRHSGGDYYDFFKLPRGQWGIMIADVSGHGTPAAVLMAITHSIAHIALDPPTPPGRVMQAINCRLCTTYAGSGNFVTGFYGVFDPATLTFTWSNAGHPPPRWRRADGSLDVLPIAGSLPLGIEADERFPETVTQLSPGDALLFYTDGITEARNVAGDMFDPERLDDVLRPYPASAADVIAATLAALERFAGGLPLTDDRTLVAAKVT